MNRPDTGAVEPLQRIYQVGIIGCGRIAGTIEAEVQNSPILRLLPYSHANAYGRVPRTRLIAAADPNRDRLEAFGSRYGISNLYTDYREMLDHMPLDIISICAPTRVHCPIALDVARYPVKGVYLEKPIAQSLAEADRMIAAFQAAGIKVVVNHFRTFDPIWDRVRNLVHTGSIGSLRVVICHWVEGAAFGGSHLFDLLRSLIGEEAEWVFGTVTPGIRFDPGVRGILSFRNDIQVFINCTELHPVGTELDIVGSEGRIRIGDALYPEYWKVIEVDQRPRLALVGFPGAVDAQSAMVRAIEALLRSIEQDEKPASDARDARADLELAVAFHLSARAGVPVRLPITDTDYLVTDPWGRG